MMLAEHAKLAREAADANQDYLEYLLRLSELELASRASNALQQRLHTAAFPIQKELDTFDFSAARGINSLPRKPDQEGHSVPLGWRIRWL
jgi:DNA replication protein DnaC